MEHITTYTGEEFSPLSPNKEQIKILDIAHALSLMCRANGHFKRFFSVAQHSINCAIEAKARGCSIKVQLACLLHDASEAYISDITRPVKKSLTNYMEIEKHLQNLLFNKFLDEPLTDDEQTHVNQIDDDMLICEFGVLMEKPVFDKKPQVKGDLYFDTRDFTSVEKQFIQLFNSLSGTIGHSLLPKGAFMSVGIDGCKGKWLAVELSDNGFCVRLFDNINYVSSHYKNADCIMIDMPIGLAESKADIRPDEELRKNLKGKASSVFNTPCRQSVYETGYEKSSVTNNEIMSKKLSRQSFAIIPKIREIDIFLQTHTEWKNRILESHPEYCFTLLNGNIPVFENKQTLEGSEKRLNILCRYFPQSHEVVDLFKRTYPTLSSKTDDVIDALVLALIGAIGLDAGFTSIPEFPMHDTQGIKMQIVGVKVPHIDEVK